MGMKIKTSSNLNKDFKDLNCRKNVNASFFYIQRENKVWKWLALISVVEEFFKTFWNKYSPQGLATNSSVVFILFLSAIEKQAIDLWYRFFPSFFTALAFDPLQKIMAIGNRSGKIRLYGRPGVDVEFQHQKEVAIFKIIFVVNTGRLLTATTGSWRVF